MLLATSVLGFVLSDSTSFCGTSRTPLPQLARSVEERLALQAFERCDDDFTRRLGPAAVSSSIDDGPISAYHCDGDVRTVVRVVVRFACQE